ncbi:substrate-binding domain-containing protein [Neotabrizicola shimadae]|uniref:Extracellular solute-binding protein n=1 Tax=Neotabrizicola shimadae TaxID=2807096 RepID=A0A8G0ZRW4_9RHOB|nr:substrate-binding domain-containing protein [Neotabrizicola shimadae]QYZ69334.1 extracellular solute-binding protein [Neotabrizicola shimadae]
MAFQVSIPGGSFSRRGFLRGTAATAGALMLPGRLMAQDLGPLVEWLPGGSPLFCEIHTGLLAGFAERGGFSASETVCGLGQNTEFNQSLIGAIASGNPPDISMLWDSPVSLGAQGAFMPLDEMMKGSTIPLETWPGGLLASCQFRGVTYGLPVTAGIYTMWFNQDMFEAKGIPTDRASFPKTWDEMRKLSKEFTVWDGDYLQVAGFVPPRAVEPMAVWSALNGGKLYDAANLKYMLDSEQNIEMFNYFLDWLNEEYKGDVNLIDRSGNFTDGYPNTTTGMGPAFRESRLAGMQSGSWLMGDFYSDPVPNFQRWDLAAHPVGPSGSATAAGIWPNWFVIPVGSKNPQAAFDYLAYLSVEGVVKWYEQIPDVPTNSQVKAKPPASLVERRGQEFADSASAFLQEQASIVTPMWDSPVQGFATDQMTRAVEKIYTKAATPAEALAEAQSACQTELERVLAG